MSGTTLSAAHSTCAPQLPQPPHRTEVSDRPHNVKVMDVVEQAKADVHQVWIYGANVYADRDLDALTEQQRTAVLANRQARIALYAKLVLVELAADPSRLTAAAQGCRARLAERMVQGRDPHTSPTSGYARGAELADLAVQMIRDAGADTNLAKRERLLNRAQRDTTLFGEPSAGHKAIEWVWVTAGNWRWLRKLRRLSPQWRRRQAVLAAVSIQADVADTADGQSEILAMLGEEMIGKATFQTCTQCRRGLLCKVNAYEPYDGIGLGTLLIDACVVAGGLPADGYTWHTTPQYDSAQGFWRAMATRHRTAFTAPPQASCPHM